VSDVFQEVEEEYRRQQLAKLWDKYRVHLIGAASALVLGVGAYQAWSYWRAEQASASSRAFDAGVRDIDANDPKAAADRFSKLSQKAVGGYVILSRLHEANLKAQTGDAASAVKIYDDVAASTSDPLFSHLATLRAAMLTVETASLDETRKRLEPVIASGDSWTPGALELLAYATWRAGKSADALKLYDQLIALEGAPEKTKRRATEMRALIAGGMTLAVLNNNVALPSSTSPGLLPFGLEPPKPEAPGSLLGPADVPALPDPTQPSPETIPPATPPATP
jgi:hypothetical protein